MVLFGVVAFGAFTLVYPCKAKGLAALGLEVTVEAGDPRLPPPCNCSYIWSESCPDGGCITTSSGCGFLWMNACNGTWIDDGNPSGGGGSGAGLIGPDGALKTTDGFLPGTPVEMSIPSTPKAPGPVTKPSTRK